MDSRDTNALMRLPVLEDCSSCPARRLCTVGGTSTSRWDASAYLPDAIHPSTMKLTARCDNRGRCPWVDGVFG